MENSSASLRATKKLLTDHARAELDLQIEAAVRENAAIRSTADFREGISSFLEKRKAGVDREMKSSSHPVSTKPACACAMPRPIRWASCTTRIT